MTTPANGVLSVQGQQFGLPQGSAFIGPFSIPFSPVSEVLVVPANSTNLSITVPAGIQGVMLAPNGTAGMTCKFGFITAQVTFMSTVLPTFINFDIVTPDVPTTLFMTVSNTTGAVVTVQFY